MCQAVLKQMSEAAALSKDSDDGRGITFAASHRVYSAKVPHSVTPIRLPFRQMPSMPVRHMRHFPQL